MDSRENREALGRTGGENLRVGLPGEGDSCGGERSRGSVADVIFEERIPNSLTREVYNMTRTLRWMTRLVPGIV